MLLHLERSSRDLLLGLISLAIPDSVRWLFSEEDFFSFADVHLEDSSQLWLRGEQEDEEHLDLSDDNFSEFLEWLLDSGEGNLLSGDWNR
ncbi:hypothetical protein H920_14772 [Fukomys damarensis]|uniref:Uncharacterized protein n=1 Tax=Fukomys damarensis TaxID=885580 RepID=A0A091CYP5_FUKDA|nr:hypothetical protein H920_14772 [Fukomys damarensis]